MSWVSTRLRRSAAIALAAGVFGALGAVPGTAAAAPCDGVLNDSFGASWDYEYTGAIDDGSVGNRSDAYDGFPGVLVSPDQGATWSRYSNPDEYGCTTEDNGRQIAYPADTTTVPGLEITRKIYVPASGTAFARFLTVFRNTGSTDVTLDVDLAGGSNGSFDLGSDSDTLVDNSSSGDGNTQQGDTSAMTAADNWATTWDGYTTDNNGGPGPVLATAAAATPDGDPTLAHNWQYDGTGAADSADEVGAPQDPDTLVFRFNAVTIPAGATVAYANFEAMRDDNAQTTEIAKYLGQMPVDATEGLTLDELDAIQNWPAYDRDHDGYRNRADNCAGVANDQADADGDGQGDVCDDDIDGDGYSNDLERELGTSQNTADTDGDGVNDRADACPKKAGTDADGCPVATTVTTPPPAPDTAPPTTVLQSRATFSLTSLLNGINVNVVCDEQCDGMVRLLTQQAPGSVRTSSVNRGYNVVLGRKYVAMGGGLRKVTVRPCERKPGGPQSKSCLKRLKATSLKRGSFRVKIFVTTTDKAGNRTQKTKVITIKVPRRRR